MAQHVDGPLLVGGSFARALGRSHPGLARFKVRAAKPDRRLAITADGGDIRVHWDGGGQLLEATALPGPWRKVPQANSPYSPAAEPGARFYHWAE